MSTSPPPGEPGPHETSPELLYSLFPHVEPLTGEPTGPVRRPRRLWRLPTVPVLAGLILVVLSSGVFVAVDETGQGQAVAAAASMSSSDTTFEDLPIAPAAPILPAADPAPRTRPEPAPVNERPAQVPIVKIGEIRIPKIGLVHPIFEGVTLTVIDHGPGHWPGTAAPGQLGNAVFAGHRVTHSHPFRNVDKLMPGDEIIFVMPNGTFTYKMTKQQIVKPADTWIVNPTKTPTLTLFACHPPGSAANRIVIRADFVGRT